MLNQLETQKIDQTVIFSGVCKKSVSLPIIKDDDDIWYCQRLINEALTALNQHGSGPVHINVPLIGNQNDLVDASVAFKKFGTANKIEYIAENNGAVWDRMAEKLNASKRILVVMGQMSNIDSSEKSAMDNFFNAYQCPILADNLSNYRCEQMVFSEAVIKALNSKTAAPLVPDIVISFGCNFQERIKDIMRAHKGNFEHWSIEPSGNVKDVFKSQTALFECPTEVFFQKMTELHKDNNGGSDEYLKKWKRLEKAISLPEMPFNNFYTVQEFAKVIPQNSLLHLSILNCTRLMQFFKLDESVKVYSNVNAFGIDGCLPTFMGQAYGTDCPAFLVTGDLSFFYGMNAAAIKHRKNNIRILLINNGGGAEFHIMPDSNLIPTIDLHIGAAHDRKAQGWAESIGYEYLRADNKESLASALKSFVNNNHDAPVLLEVFTDMKKDGEYTLSVYRHIEKCIESELNRMGENE